MLLHDSPSSVMLQVEQVLSILGHHSHTDAEMGALEVRHGFKALLPHGIFLILNREKCNGQCGSSGEAALTQGGECGVCRLLDGGVGLVACQLPPLTSPKTNW
jgi:hypothetical protein